MALYGKLELAKTTRLFNMGKDLGAFFISSYMEDVSEEENIERNNNLLKMIQKQGLSYVPVFAGDFEHKVIKKDRVCYYVINRKGASNDANQLMTDEAFFNIGKDLCNEFNKTKLIVLNHGETRVYDINTNDYGLLHWGVFFLELINMATNTKLELEHAIEVQYYVRTFLTMNGLQATGYAGERHLWKEEFPYGKDNSFEVDII